MRKLFSILILVYYSIGSLFLPASDFSIIPELPQLYSHCKATEDKDMNFADFITDHLMNLDGIFDNHDNGDEQKPHKSLEHQISSSYVYLPSHLNILNTTKIECSTEKIQFANNKYCFDFVANVFRPPIG